MLSLSRVTLVHYLVVYSLCGYEGHRIAVGEALVFTDGRRGNIPEEIGKQGL